MSNSSLVSYIRISPNRTSPRNHVIDTITIHCMAGNLTVENCGELFSKQTRCASSNYGIGSDGRIAMYVEESDRSWCSSNKANDHRAITIEVANDGGENTGWHVSEKAMNSLIRLLVDICKRNNIKELKWKGNPSLVGNISKQNMTVHRWFSAKSCPGDYLYSKHGYIAQEVNKQLRGDISDLPTSAPSGTNECPYMIKVAGVKNGDVLNIRKQPNATSAIVGRLEYDDQNKYTIVATHGNWGKLKSGIGWINLTYTKRV